MESASATSRGLTLGVCGRPPMFLPGADAAVRDVNYVRPRPRQRVRGAKAARALRCPEEQISATGRRPSRGREPAVPPHVVGVAEGLEDVLDPYSYRA